MVVEIDATGNETFKSFTQDDGIRIPLEQEWQQYPCPTINRIGTYKFGELVTGSVSGAIGRVKWDADDKILNLGTTDKDFISGDVGIGSDSGAQYAVDRIISSEFNDKYDKGSEIETAADT